MRNLLITTMVLLLNWIALPIHAEYTPGDVSGFGTDILVPVSSGKANQTNQGSGPYGHGYGIENTFDGQKDPTFQDQTLPIYASPYNGGTNFPVELEYSFGETARIDYFVYYPKSGNSNGCFKEFEVWAKYGGNTDYRLVGTYDLKGIQQVYSGLFSEKIENPTAIKFTIKSANSDLVSFSQMEFFSKNENSLAPDIFTDETCSALKTGVDRQQIESVSNEFYRKLGLALLEGTYNAEFRIQSYKAYADPSVQASINKTSTYGQYDNPTGIYAEEGEDMVVFVGNTNGQTVSLRQMDLDKETEGQDGFGAISTYSLSEGLNIFKTNRKGLFYFMHIQDDYKTAPAVTVNIATGQVNGYFDKTRHNNTDWIKLLSGAKSKFMDVVGEYAHVIFPVKSYQTYCPKQGAELIQVYDSIVYLQQEFLGIHKYPERKYGNRAMFTVMYTAYMYATGNHTAYNVGTMSAVCNPAKLRTTDIWGPSHEMGHTHQTRPGLKWAACAEVTNNIYAMYVQTKFGNKTRMSTQSTSNGRKSHYENSFNTILRDSIPFITAPGEFNRLIPFWQLYLYTKYVKNYPDFYKDLHEEIRKQTDLSASSMSGRISINFTTLCSALLQEDLSDFFKAWGFYQPLSNVTVNDYGSHTVSITQKMIDDAITQNAQWAKPTYKIAYLHDNNIESYANQMSIIKGTATRSKNTFSFQNWQHVVAYEIYDEKGVLQYISPIPEFTTIGVDAITQPTGRAVAYDGSYILVEFDKEEVPVAQLPVISTEEAPIWYYAENGHNSDKTTNHMEINDTDGRFCTIMTAQENENGTTNFVYTSSLFPKRTNRDYQLWRLEDAGNGTAYLINKATGNKLAYGVSPEQAGDRYYTSGNNEKGAGKFQFEEVKNSSFVTFKNMNLSTPVLMGAFNSGYNWGVFDNNNTLPVASNYSLTRSPRAWRFVEQTAMNEAYPEASGETEIWYYISNCGMDEELSSRPYDNFLTIKDEMAFCTPKKSTDDEEVDTQLFKLVPVEGKPYLSNLVHKGTGKYMELSGKVSLTNSTPEGFWLRHLYKTGDELQFNIRKARNLAGEMLGVNPSDLSLPATLTTLSNDKANYNSPVAWRFEKYTKGNSATPSSLRNKVRVYEEDSYIRVIGSEAPVQVYTVAGLAIDVKKQLPAGVYIVKVAEKTVKISIK